MQGDLAGQGDGLQPLEKYGEPCRIRTCAGPRDIFFAVISLYTAAGTIMSEKNRPFLKNLHN